MTNMSWRPESAPLVQLSGCLKDSLSGHNKAAQKQAEIVCGICLPFKIRGFHSRNRTFADFVAISTAACSSKILSRYQQLPHIPIFKFASSSRTELYPGRIPCSQVGSSCNAEKQYQNWLQNNTTGIPCPRSPISTFSI